MGKAGCDSACVYGAARDWRKRSGGNLVVDDGATLPSTFYLCSLFLFFSSFFSERATYIRSARIYRRAFGLLLAPMV